MKQVDGIPSFLRLTPEARRKAWERNPPQPMPIFGPDAGRASRLTEHDLAVIRELEAGQRYTPKDYEAEAKAQEFFAKKAEEAAAIKAVQEAARLASAPPVGKASKPKARKAAPKRVTKTTQVKGRKRAKRKGH